MTEKPSKELTDEEILEEWKNNDSNPYNPLQYRQNLIKDSWSDILELMASARAEAKKKMLLTIISKKHDLCESCFEELEEAINEVEKK